MDTCRVCKAPLGAAVYSAPAPSITSTARIVDLPTSVFICRGCDHAQSPDLPDLQRFYDSEYRISLESKDHDQLYAVENGKPVYRTEKQAQVALDLLALPQGSKILDYGAAKATTLRKIKSARPDLDAFVFDVSDAYRPSWREWLDDTHVSTHFIPKGWQGCFDAVTAHFVIEHVADPRFVLAEMVKLLKPSGRLLVSTPDPLANSGDLIVVDHINHFSAHSLNRLLLDAGLRIEQVSKTILSSALVATAVKASCVDVLVPANGDARSLSHYCENWKRARENIVEKATSLRSRKAAIYGAGFYGSWIYSVVRCHLSPSCFVDNNVHLQGTTHFALPVFSPSDLPDDIEMLFVGLNPSLARDVIDLIDIPNKEQLEIIFIQG